MDKDKMKEDQSRDLNQGSDFSRTGSNPQGTGKIGKTHTEDTRRPTDTFEGSTGNISREQDLESESETDLERERLSDRERNVEQ